MHGAGSSAGAAQDELADPRHGRDRHPVAGARLPADARGRVRVQAVVACHHQLRRHFSSECNAEKNRPIRSSTGKNGHASLVTTAEDDLADALRARRRDAWVVNLSGICSGRGAHALAVVPNHC